MRHEISEPYDKTLSVMKQSTADDGYRYGGGVLMSRSVHEILEDYHYESAFAESHTTSMLRRLPKRYESAFVVELLDGLADYTDLVMKKVGDAALEHVHLLKSIDSVNKDPRRLN